MLAAGVATGGTPQTSSSGLNPWVDKEAWPELRMLGEEQPWGKAVWAISSLRYPGRRCGRPGVSWRPGCWESTSTEGRGCLCPLRPSVLEKAPGREEEGLGQVKLGKSKELSTPYSSLGGVGPAKRGAQESQSWTSFYFSRLKTKLHV